MIVSSLTENVLRKNTEIGTFKGPIFCHTQLKFSNKSVSGSPENFPGMREVHLLLKTKTNQPPGQPSVYSLPAKTNSFSKNVVF